MIVVVGLWEELLALFISPIPMMGTTQYFISLFILTFYMML